MVLHQDEIEMLDECRVFNPTENDLANQGFYCSALLAAKLYSCLLFSCLTKSSQGN